MSLINIRNLRNVNRALAEKVPQKAAERAEESAKEAARQAKAAKEAYEMAKSCISRLESRVKALEEKLGATRKITLVGDVTGEATFSGEGEIEITATLES